MAWQPDYCTYEEFQQSLKIYDDDDMAQSTLAITAASRAIDQATNRQFGKVASVEDRVYDVEWDRRRNVYVVEIDDLMTNTGLVVVDENDATVTNSTLAFYPRNAAAKGRPWTEFTCATLTPTVTVTALWGWTAVPDTIKAATILQASRFFKRKDAPFGVAGSPEFGSETRLLAKVDPDVAVMVGPYRRWWAGA